MPLQEVEGWDPLLSHCTGLEEHIADNKDSAHRSRATAMIGCEQAVWM